MTSPRNLVRVQVSQDTTSCEPQLEDLKAGFAVGEMNLSQNLNQYNDICTNCPDPLMTKQVHSGRKCSSTLRVPTLEQKYLYSVAWICIRRLYLPIAGCQGFYARADDIYPVHRNGMID